LPPEPTIRYPHPRRHELAVSIMAFNPDHDSSAKLFLSTPTTPAQARSDVPVNSAERH